MSIFTVTDLADILREGAGETEPIDWTCPKVMDATFEDLGYDSIALLETAARIEQKFGVRLEDDLGELHTPAVFITCVNQLAASK
jgi:acyl carrier protein